MRCTYILKRLQNSSGTWRPLGATTLEVVRVSRLTSTEGGNDREVGLSDDGLL